jgi:hypothetical protein
MYELQEDVTQVYLELHQGKNLHAVYEHVLHTIEETAVLIGNAEAASKDIHEEFQISLQNHMELLLILGLTQEQKSNLLDLGYTEDDITDFMDWISIYNDFNHHVTTGFTPGEMERFQTVGLTDTNIAELQAFINDHYTQVYTAQQVVNQQQTELLQLQLLLSLAALNLLEEGDHKNSKCSDILQHAQEKLYQAILTLPGESSLEHVKAYSKQVLKAAEQQIRNGNTQYKIDFFIGLQVYCGAVTALHGNTTYGLKQIQKYAQVVSECAASPERPEPSVHIDEQHPHLTQPPVTTASVGLVEESNEANNMGVMTVFVKAPDTTFLQFLTLFCAFVGETTWVNWTLPDLTLSLESLLAGSGTTLTTIATGAVGAVVLLIVTVPPTADEWPDAVPGMIQGDEILIVVEGSYGQGHIEQRAQSKKECIASSHQAILNDKYMIRDIVVHALRLFHNEYNGQYIFYYVDSAHKEWCVFVKKWGKTQFYELRTAYRMDCPPPYMCENTGKGYDTIIEKWICEGFKLISLW